MTLAELAEQVTGRVEAEAVAEAFDPDAVIAAAVARTQESKATWSRYDPRPARPRRRRGPGRTDRFPSGDRATSRRRTRRG
jgi:hypothetical protein